MKRISVAELDSRDFTLSRVGLLGLHDEDVADDALLLRTIIEQRRLGHRPLLLMLPPRGLVQRGEGRRRGVKVTQERGEERSSGRLGEKGARHKRRRREGPWPLYAGERAEGGEHR